MANGPNTNTPTTEQMMETLDGLDKQNEAQERVNNTVASGNARNSESTKKFKDEIERLRAELNKVKKTVESTELGKIFGEKDVGKNFVASLSSLKSEFNKSVAAIAERSKSLGSAIHAGIDIGVASAAESIVKKFGDATGFNALQEQLMEAEKQAIQMSIAFGRGFTTASDDADFFRNSLVKTMSITKENADEIGKVRKSIQTAFGPDAITPINTLGGALKGVGSNIDLTTTALLLSKATGTDHGVITKAMTEAHLELGMSVDETAEAFGHIRDAAKNSGLEFGKVTESIMSAAKAMKWYGASVETVSPLFKKFNESMKGVGKEGLTPELLQGFVDGLASMEFGTRALLSLQAAPGGMTGGRGVLGGGLAMEQALETGEGMEEVTQNLTETLKRFSGQDRVITREEALENPQLERAYVVQRQMLQKMTKVADPGKQNEMLRALGNIDANGMAASADAQSTLEEVLAAGKKTAEDTTTELAKRQLNTQERIFQSGEKVLKVLTERLRGSELHRVMQSLDRGFATMAQSGHGNILDAAKSHYLRQKSSDRVDTYGRVTERSSRKERAAAVRQSTLAGIESGRATKIEAVGRKGETAAFERSLGDVIRRMLGAAKESGDAGQLRKAERMAEQFKRTGTVRDKNVRKLAIEEAVAPMEVRRTQVKQRIEEIQEQKRQTGGDTTQADLEINRLRQEFKFLGGTIKGTSKFFNKWQDTLTSGERKARGAKAEVARAAHAERSEVRAGLLEGTARIDEGTVAGRRDGLGRPDRSPRGIVEQAREATKRKTKVRAMLRGSEEEAAIDRAAKLEQGTAVQTKSGEQPAAERSTRTEEVVLKVQLEVDSEGNFIAKDDLVVELAKEIGSGDSASELRNAIVKATTIEASARK